ncbi:MAG: fibronectin type III domain-containing protein, partial [Chloroflexota bacterium]|nr:fibronectin type III domain-containing protein [Chloroflexota bacterium]
MSAFNPAPPIRRWPLQAAALLLALAVLLLSPGAARAQSAVPTVTGVAITSSAGPDATYALGQRIRVTLTFSEAVNVSGTPQVAIDMDPAGWGTKLANYLRGGGGTHLTFAHTVVEPNYSTQGVAVLANSLALNGGSVTSVSSGTAAALSHAGLGHDPNHKVNWQMIAPTVTGVAVTSDPGGDDTYAMDDVIEVTLTFSEAVAVTGTPQLAIDMDPAHWGTKWAAYHGGSGSTRLTFTHTVVEPNLSTRGVAVLADSLRRNGGTIRSVSTQTDVQRAHAGLDHDAGHKVDWRIAGCERTAPSSVSALTIGQGAVVSWTLPADLSGACRVTGFVVSAVHLEEPFEQRHHIIDPEARSHTIRGLIPGDHRFAVSVEYAEGESEDFEVAYANNVPDACISLAIKPYARNAVSGRITSVNGTGCEARETFDLELKRSSDDYWRGYSALPWRYVDTQTDASQPHFIFYGIDPHVAYDFRISAYDASDSKYSTTAQSVTIKAQDPSATSAAGSPSARFLANNNGNIVVSWNSYSAPTGRTVTGIALEIKSCSDPAMASCDGAVMSAWVPVSTESSAQWFTRYHRFTGLTNGVYYTARVAARTHASSEPASTATDAWTAWLPATRVWS